MLAAIDDAQPRAAVDQATAALAAAQKEVAAADSDFALAGTTLKRYQQLYDKKSVSPQEFDEIKARYQSAEARRDMARGRAGTSERRAGSSSHFARLHACSRAVFRRRDGEDGRCRARSPRRACRSSRSRTRATTGWKRRWMKATFISSASEQAASVTIDSLGNCGGSRQSH